MLEEKTSEIKDHAEFSASGSARWLNCPGSHALSKTAPPQKESAYAAEGTEAHACLEFLLKNKTSILTAEKTARKKWSADMVDHALAAVDWIMERLNNANEAEFLCETKVDASPFTCSGQFGTLDAAIVEEFGRLVVIDYKYGAGLAVDPVNDDGTLNSQLVYYALGVSFLYNHNFKDVELVVIQPRAYHESGDTVRSVVVPVEDILAWVPRFRDGVMTTSDPKAPLHAGSWCKFCPAAVLCPELKGSALKRAQVVFDDATGVIELPSTAITKLPNLGTILDGCERLEAWIAKVREHAEHVLEQGGDVPGFKLVAKRAQRKWTDEDLATAQALSSYGKNVFSPQKLLSPAQFEKKFKGSNEWVSARTSAESSGTTLVRDTDRRPDVRSIETVFTEVSSLPPTKKSKSR